MINMTTSPVYNKNAPEYTARQLGPCTRAVNSGSGNRALGLLIIFGRDIPYSILNWLR